MAAAARDPLAAAGLDEADEAVRGTCEDASVCKRYRRLARGERRGGPGPSDVPLHRAAVLVGVRAGGEAAKHGPAPGKPGWRRELRASSFPGCCRARRGRCPLSASGPERLEGPAGPGNAHSAVQCVAR